MYNKTFLLIAALATVNASVAATAAEARDRSRAVSVEGANGAGFTRSRAVSREQGSASVTRGTQTNSGTGVETTRAASWGDGSYTGTKTTTTNNGQSASRATSVTNNGDGSAAFSTTVTGPEGQSKTVGGTVTVTKDPQ